jgi:ABC-2 type transport system ATP-binding protein
MEEAEFLADHIAIIHKGKIIAEGSLEELICNYGRGDKLKIYGCKGDDIVSLLKSKNFNVSDEGNGNITVKIDNNDRVLEIISQLRHECIEFDRIDIRRPNLEEIFLYLTGAELSGDNI